MPNGNSSDQWFLEINGKKFGPYTMAQIEALVRHHEIAGEDRVTAPQLNGKWISVQDFVRQSGHQEASRRSAAPATVPPRPDERTLTSITSPSIRSPNDKRGSGSDAILNLFEILQAARERKTPTSSVVGHAPLGNAMVEVPRPVRSSSGGSLFWFAVPALAVAAVIAWKVMGSSTVAETETSAKPSKAAQNASAPAQPAAQHVAVTAVAPPAKPKTVSAPISGFTAGRQQLRPVQVTTSTSLTDRERERELEREREREAERELEREKEREAEYARNYSSNDPSHRERERERERDSERGTDRATASVGIVPPDALPVTGGTPVEPAAFRDMNRDTSGEPETINHPVN